MIGWLAVAGALLAGPLSAGWGAVSPGPPPASLVASMGPTGSVMESTSTSPQDRWIAEDKARHFALSFAATSMAYGGARLRLDPGPGRRTAAAVALLLGVGKELVDVRNGGPFSLKDLAWDAAGVALGSLLAQQIR